MIFTGAEIAERLARTGDGRLILWPFFSQKHQVDSGAASLDLRLGSRFAAAKRRRLTHIRSVPRAFPLQ